MALFNIRRNDNNKTPEELSNEIKEVKAKIRAYKDEISRIRNDKNKTIKDIREKIDKENANFEKQMKKVDTEKASLLKKTKAFEKKKKAGLERIENEKNTINGDIETLKHKANSKKERKLKTTKKSLQDELKAKEKEYIEHRTKIEQEHQHAIDHFDSLIQFEEDAVAEAKEKKAKLIAEAEERIAELQEKKEKLASTRSHKVETMNKTYDKKKNAINVKTSDLLSKQKSELKDLYEELDSAIKSRNSLVDKFDKEKKEIEKEYSQLVSKHTSDVESATNYNNALSVDLKKEETQFNAIVEKHNTEYEELKYFLATLVEKIPAEVKSLTKEQKKEYNEREKELEKKAAELKHSFDEEIKRRNIVLDNEIADLKLQVEKNAKVYDQNIRTGENNNESIKKDYKNSLEVVTTEKNDLLSEINKLDLEYKEKIKAMNEQLTNIKKENAAFIADLDNKMNAEIDDLTAKYESSKSDKIAQIKQEIQSTKNDIAQINTEHKQFVDEFANKRQTFITQNEKEMNLLNNEKDSLTSSINLLREEINTKKEEFVKQLADINIRISNTKNDRVEKIKHLENEHAQSLVTLQQKYDNKFSDLKNDFDTSMADLESKSDEKKREINNKATELEGTTNDRIATLEKEGLELRENYESQIQKVIEQKNDILVQIQTLKDNFANSEELFDQEFNLIKQSFEDNKNTMENEHADKIKEIVRQYEEVPSQEIEELKAKYESEKEKYTLLNSDLFAQRNQIEIEYEREKAELIARKNELTSDIEKKNALLSELTSEKDSEYKFQLERVNSKKAELDELKTDINTEIQSINEKHNLELANLTDDYNRKYNDVVSKYNQEEMILKNRLDGEIQYVSRDYDRRRSDFENKLTEATIRKDKIESDLKSKYNIELEKSKAVENELKILENEFKYKKADYDNRLDIKKKEYDENIELLKQRHDNEIVDMKERYGEILSDLNTKKAQINKEIDLLIEEYNNKTKAIEEIKQSQNKEISLLKMQITQLIEQFNKNDVFGEKQARLELMHNKRMSEIKQDYADIIEEFETLQSTRQGAGGILINNENELTKKAEDFKRILDTLDSKHQETMEELKNQYDISLRTISDEFKNYVEGNKNAIENCDNEIINLQTTYDNLIKAEEQKFKKLDAELALNKKQIEMIETQFNESVKQIESGFNDVGDAERQKSQYVLENERKAYEREIRDIQNEIDNLESPRGSLSMKVRDLAKQQTMLEDEIFDQKQKLISLLDTAFSRLSASYRDRVSDQKSKLKQYDIYSNKKPDVFKK